MGEKLSMQEVQQIAVDVLKKITLVCDANGIRYSLAFGTLIGAIRHKGFIPWDDDIDLLMPRPDYERFLKIMEKNPIDNLKVFNYRTEKSYIYAITRVCDMRYKIIEHRSRDCGMGVFVDIYPLDGMGNTLDEAKVINENAFYLRNKVILLSQKNELKLCRNPFKLLPRVFRYFKAQYEIKFKLVDYQNKLDELVSQTPFENSTYVGVPIWEGMRVCFKREWFDDVIKIPFESTEFYAVREYDALLRSSYGDYMHLPPIDQRVYHHFFDAYRIY